MVNRARSAKFPRSVCGVVADGCQFSYRCDGRSDVLADPAPAPTPSRSPRPCSPAPPTSPSGALFFHSARVAPGWFNTRPRVGTFGGNVFYR